jgi:glycosyltransferase involved in cell wall biosynthesis
MISVIVPTLNHEAVLGRTLAPLVPAAVSGFVREVIVADGGSSDATLDIADDAGCGICRTEGDAEARVRAAAKGARADWLMLLPAGVQLLPGWEVALRERLEKGADDALVLPAIDPRAGWLKRVLGGRGEGARVLRKAALKSANGSGGRRLSGCAILIRVEA